MLSVYDVNLYMFRAYLGSSSGGTTVCIQQLVLIILFRRLSAVLVGLELQVQYNQDSCANCCIHTVIEASWNVMAHAKKPDFVFRRNGRVHLNRRGRQFSRLLAAEVCLSAVVMLDTPCSEVVWRVLATHSIRQFPLHFSSLASPKGHHISTGVDLLMIGLDTPETCRVWRSILRINCASSWFFFTWFYPVARSRKQEI